MFANRPSSPPSPRRLTASLASSFRSLKSLAPALARRCSISRMAKVSSVSEAARPRSLRLTLTSAARPFSAAPSRCIVWVSCGAAAVAALAASASSAVRSSMRVSCCNSRLSSTCRRSASPASAVPFLPLAAIVRIISFMLSRAAASSRRSRLVSSASSGLGLTTVAKTLVSSSSSSASLAMVAESGERLTSAVAACGLAT
mmetsp:Transcript_66416/g.160321  ORF Transcript_66416/g.160321 Transcript_66416/m.160321 type:complete len:201 (+) Transcript_66416:311-913(+)